MLGVNGQPIIDLFPTPEPNGKEKIRRSGKQDYDRHRPDHRNLNSEQKNGSGDGGELTNHGDPPKLYQPRRIEIVVGKILADCRRVRIVGRMGHGLLWLILPFEWAINSYIKPTLDHH